ncbi:carbon-nitrogen hydrolase family protein [Hyphococcus flavus]|uniref:Carbon-nitrogen hydrolase family protein n=1 Tax=Hyphococcus flavus TaxID=1866326 RepID=A0AAE9ZD87_9PROT|nr:carbon-nitrogen hydrolase family protein [Hyphococcus flavus]WDI30498.1 carbon-nitrogen hydrolase family protein [Hyphococcus flavus]
MTENGSFRAACVQMRSGLDRQRNTSDAIALIKEAAEAGASFIATPEMTNVIDRKGSRLLSDLPSENDLTEIKAFSEAAQSNHVWLLAGSFAVKTEPSRAANRSFLFGPDGNIAARYDKLNMFDVDLPNGESWKESAIYAPGQKAVVAKTSIASFGLSICYDVRFPQQYRAMAQAGADVLCVPAAFTRQTGEAHWKTLLRARAIENGAFVIAPAQGGVHEDGRETYGHSLIIGPWGEILAEAPDDAPGLVFADINPAAAAEARRRIPNLALEHSREVSIVSL